MKALLLDDSKLALKHLEFVIHKVNSKIKTTLCDSYQGAIECLESGDFDIIFIDLQLPARNGADLLVYMNQEKRFQNMKKVIVTGTGEDSLLKASYESAVDAYLHKPIKEEDLIKILGS